MSQHNDTEPHYKAHKRSLLLRFIVFVAWVAVIGLFISLIACQPNNHKTFVNKEVAQ